MASRKSDTKQADDAAVMLAPFQDTVTSLQSQMAQMMTGNAEIARRCMDGWVSLMTELMDFSGRRLQDNLDTLERTTRCQDPGEALRLQMSGIQTTIRVYADEAGRLYTLCSQTGEDCLKAFDNKAEGAGSGERPNAVE